MKEKGLLKYIPIEYKHLINDVDFNKYFDLGYRILFFDLDNTIADYETHYPEDDKIELFKNLKEKGFSCFILSNNKEKRIKKFEESLGVKGFYSLRKPFTHRIKKYILNESMDINKILWIGDQAVTDVKCAHSLGINTILLDPIKPATEHWYTKINRFIEKRIFLRIRKKYSSVYSNLGLENRYGRR